MERLYGLDTLPLGAERTVVTVGFFDGVHLGHRAVLDRTADAAREIVRLWLETEFAGGRHQRRIDKIIALEKRGSR